MVKLAIAVVCHAAYLPLLPEAIGSVESQTSRFDELVLVLDGCDSPSWVENSGWKVVCLNAGNPNPCRNAAIDATDSEWIIFWDADNLMHSEYAATARRRICEVGEGVAFIYPNLHYFGKRRKIVCPPDYDEHSVTERNCYDTSAAWRREALDMERWDNDSLCHDDWSLVLRLKQRGWSGARMLTHIDMREHDLGRRSISGLHNEDNKRAEMLWKIRSMGVCSLVSRPERVKPLMQQLQFLNLPEKRSLYLLDNMHEESASRDLWNAAMSLDGWQSKTILKQGKPTKERRERGDAGDNRLKHIASLTQDLWSRVSEDILFSIDDDCESRDEDAVRKLHYHVRPKEFSVAGAAYNSKRANGCLVATFSKDQYGTAIPQDYDKFSEVAAVGAGFTLYVRSHLREAFPIRPFIKNGFAGHDYNVCHALRRNGKKVALDATVRVDHA